MHPTVHFQNQRSVEAGNYGNATSHGYRLYLLDPPAPAFDLKTPLPVSSYAKFMQESWWETEFVKFGHQGLRLSIHSTDPSSPMMSVIRPNQTVAEFFPLLTSVIKSVGVLGFINNHALPRLREHQLISIMRYLSLLTREAASAKLFRNRLHYEKRTWPTRVHGIQDLTSTSTQGFNAIWNRVLETLQQPLSDATAARVSDLTETMRGLLRNLMELNRKSVAHSVRQAHCKATEILQVFSA